MSIFKVKEILTVIAAGLIIFHKPNLIPQLAEYGVIFANYSSVAVVKYKVVYTPGWSPDMIDVPKIFKMLPENTANILESRYRELLKIHDSAPATYSALYNRLLIESKEAAEIQCKWAAHIISLVISAKKLETMQQIRNVIYSLQGNIAAGWVHNNSIVFIGGCHEDDVNALRIHYRAERILTGAALNELREIHDKYWIDLVLTP